MIDIRPLNTNELFHIAEIDVTEDGETFYQYDHSSLRECVEPWHRPRWDAAQVQRRIAGFAAELARGGVVIGAFDGELLVGAASLRYRLEPDMAQLASLHVSQSHRRMGVASALTAEVFRLARESGAKRIYVSATPSRSAVGFYRRQGFELAEKVNEELFALEPEDIHMIKHLQTNDCPFGNQSPIEIGV
jgi:ribosomal protein S18 acetylase RimI-like enzyme